MRAPYRCSVPIQLRFRDTDAMGHVNNAVYLSHLEVARAGYWRRVLGLQSYNDVDFILARLEIDFVAPLFEQDDVRVWIRVNRIGRRSFNFLYEMVRGPDDEVVARAESVQVMFDYARSCSKPLADEQRRLILEFEDDAAVAVEEAGA